MRENERGASDNGNKVSTQRDPNEDKLELVLQVKSEYYLYKSLYKCPLRIVIMN